MKKSNYLKQLDAMEEKNFMAKIDAMEAHGEMGWDNVIGDLYPSEYDGINMQGQGINMNQYGNNFDWADGGNAQLRAVGIGRIPGMQRTISVQLKNNTGIDTDRAAAQDVIFQLFNATDATLPGSSGLGITTNSPALSVTVNGRFYAGTTSTASATPDLEVFGRPATYQQMLNESLTSPYQCVGLRINTSDQDQLINSFTSFTNDVLGNQMTRPYTPNDKFSAFQQQSGIIEDADFQIKIDGNTGLNYTVFSPTTLGHASTATVVTLSMYVIKQATVERVLNGQSALNISKQQGMPTAAQRLQIGK